MQEALEKAKSFNLDLVEVAPNAKPPVAKIVEWTKYKYEQRKKLKDSKHKTSQLKEMWFKVFISDGDLEHKLKKVKEFIKDKDSVNIVIIGKRRAKREHFEILMTKILKQIDPYAEPQSPPKTQGKNYSVIIKPRKTKVGDAKIPSATTQNMPIDAKIQNVLIHENNDEKQNEDAQSDKETLPGDHK